MMRLKNILFFGVLATLSLAAAGQTVCPTAPDFMNLNDSCVVCTYGYTEDPYLHTGLANTRHTLITTQGFDPYTGNQLPLIPNGENQSIRLGNPQIHSNAEAITYNFKIEHDKALLLVKFAVVFQDPGHPFSEQPRFAVRILNDQNELVETCAEYDVTARAGIPGFETYEGMGTPIRWRPWTTIALDLSSYIGQNIKVQFITYDCSQGAHFGYAYFTAECLPSKLSLAKCNTSSDTIELSAPSFCESYLWTNGGTSSSSTYVMQNNHPLMASCLITSATGCEFTLNAYISNTAFTKDIVIYDTVCEGEPYTKNYFNLPPQYRTGTFSHINSFYNKAACSGTITVYLNLTVIPQFIYINDMICSGQDYIKNGFSFIKPAVGIIRDTLFLTQTDGCDSIVYLTLTVSQTILGLPESILGNPKPCSGREEVYTMPDAEFFKKFHWLVPENINILYGQNTAVLTLQFTDDAAADTLKLYAANGCGGDTLKLFIEPKKSHYLSFSDSICTGSAYTENGFNIPRQDSAGFYIFFRNLTTGNGCDSIRSLFLYVFPTPEIEIFTSTDVICKNDSIELHVLSTSAEFKIKKINIGDILCTDGSILDTTDFKTSGKTAEGVVFWIDINDDTRGWAVGLNDTNLSWGISSPVGGGSLYHENDINWSMLDTTGYRNTIAIRKAGNAYQYPPAWWVDLDNGWFLPAITQAKILHNSAPLINHSMRIAGGKLFDGSSLWTSTQHRFETWAYMILANGVIETAHRNAIGNWRPIRYFQRTK